MVEVFRMEFISVGELAKTVLKGKEPASDLTVQVENKYLWINSISLFLRCWGANL